jgi:hypothetical protein
MAKRGRIYVYNEEGAIKELSITEFKEVSYILVNSAMNSKAPENKDLERSHPARLPPH